MIPRLGVVYAIAYVIALVWPLAFVAASRIEHDLSFAVALSDGLAFIAINAMALQFVVPSRISTVSTSVGTQRLLRFHRAMGTSILVLVILHVALLIFDEAAQTLRLFIFPDAPPRARAAAVALVALIALDATARARARIPYERWRLIHIVLAFIVLGASFVHAILVARFTADPAVRWGLYAMLVIGFSAMFYLRIARAYSGGWRDYVVADVRADHPTITTLVLRPMGHNGFTFEPGQFVWLKTTSSRYSLREHPFTISSSAARPNELQFLIRAAGDFTGSIVDLPIGSHVLVDGPHGSWFAPPNTPIVFVAGGVGITPALAALATALDRGTSVPLHVIYGCRNVGDVLGREVIEAANAHPLLHVHVVPTEAPPSWPGPHGHVTRDVLEALIADPRSHAWFVCGPPPMIASVRAALGELSVPERHIHFESF